MSTFDSKHIYTHMQAAVDIVQNSPHPTSKVAATIAIESESGGKNETWAFSRTNQWPLAIEKTIGTNTKIGNASATIHAETACIFAAYEQGRATQNAALFVTDPPCPNCMKNIAESGITKLYIDHKGFDKDWARRRGEHFETMSMRVAAKAGIDVYVIYRKEQKFEIISRHAPDYKPKIENLATIQPCNNWEETLEKAKSEFGDEPFAIAQVQNKIGKTLSILVDRHPTIGYTYETVENKQDKYSFILQPINRLLMIAAKEGLTIDPNYIFSSRVPTSRELVNFIGAKFDALEIGDQSQSRDEHGKTALKQLTQKNILTTKGKNHEI